MANTFSYRRLEVVSGSPAAEDFRERWPALFCEAEIKEEFRRITTASLEQGFMYKLDPLHNKAYCPDDDQGRYHRDQSEAVSKQTEPGREMFPGCGRTAKACTLPMGLIYALNLAYPPTLRYAFEVFQKLFLELDVVKMSPKVQSLKLKLLS
ncbi:hypothetical protein DPEC_G00237190 [Dallia pectoralis]|uniref:Uncharacterized protein n=1 Tax=Dallia pectoralis TaxID=75939 RepID=A0ACC2FYG7_DALPE|nr:hypothetical protein DPEC_G00237190 [Dallia pectoralis]